MNCPHCGRRIALRQRSAILRPRELEVLQLLAQGLSRNEIARETKLTYSTIKNHINNAVRTLDVHDALTAVVFALNERWIVLPEQIQRRSRKDVAAISESKVSPDVH